MTFPATIARTQRCSVHYRNTCGLAFAVLLAIACKHARAAGPDLPDAPAAPAPIVTPASEEQRRRAQEENEARQRRLQKPRVELAVPRFEPSADPTQRAAAPPDIPAENATADSLALPIETPCFPLRRLVLQVPPHLSAATRQAGASALPFDPFRFGQQYLDRYAGACVNARGVNLIIQRLTQLLLREGWSTTRVGVSEQNLSEGTLTVSLLPGVLRAIRFDDGSARDDASHRRSFSANAFPMRAGDLLNLRDLEQGLEQLKRLPSREVDLQIVPAELPGQSDVVVSVRRSRPWRVLASLDDSGAKATGRQQANLSLAIDDALGLNDQLELGVQTDADGAKGRRGTSGQHASWSMPMGYWNIGISGGAYRYRQSIATRHSEYVSSGRSSNLEMRLSHVFQRDAMQKNSVRLRLGKQWSKAYLDDTEIEVQRRNTSFAELAWLHTHYLGDARLDLTLASRWGVAWFNGQADRDWRTADDPTFRYALQSLDASLSLPFQLAGLPLTYLGTLRGQTTQSPLYQSEMFAIGGRYTVRGFDGEMTLAAERGFFMRNELDLPILSTHSIYAGVDAGKVFGPSVPWLLGDTLAGAAAGVRGNLAGIAYDVFASWPLYKPRDFPGSHPVVNFQLSYRY